MDKQKAISDFGLDSNRPVITIIGGSQGSLAINSIVSDSINFIVNKLNTQVIWQTGTNHFENLHHFESEYSSVKVVPFIENMGAAYAAADFVISRAGAITLSEIAYCGKPSLLIPFPGAAADHQTKNAKSLENAGAAIVLSEAELTKEIFQIKIKQVLNKKEKLENMGLAAKSVSITNASEKIAGQILELVNQ